MLTNALYMNLSLEKPMIHVWDEKPSHGVSKFFIFVSEIP